MHDTVSPTVSYHFGVDKRLYYNHSVKSCRKQNLPVANVLLSTARSVLSSRCRSHLHYAIYRDFTSHIDPSV
jgi:hypothetical protein